ncbi:hypothetical protein TRAPUB_7495 [Trametes pubescens]|uniref:Zn(2)-C6 fungal-type domain-containing protein n=1 Tax=Trametes pubescens TaxID=154538 RepID=A0A1M2V390_TRAPU|nr:hypothetical protein TRAPUB_7495 [Trametes pubescens]
MPKTFTILGYANTNRRRLSFSSRTRKTRCDGAKPICFHCQKRPPENGEQCNYEPQPKRRGQDKAPGHRAQKVSKRRRTSAGDSGHSGSDSSNSSQSTHAHQTQSPQHCTSIGDYFDEEESSEESVSEYYDPFATVDLDIDAVIAFPGVRTEDTDKDREDEADSIPARPGLQFTRETWWDALLTFYSDETGTSQAIALTTEQRGTAMRSIVADLRALFHSSLYWASFIHLPRFFDAVLNPARRATMQPGLMLSALAAGILAQSSEAERGAPGRERAVRLLGLADGAVQASLATGWVDIGLIQATWLIAYFEMQSHPLHSEERGRSSLLLLDSLFRVFNMTTLDADLVQAHASERARGVPAMNGFASVPPGPSLDNAFTPREATFSPFSGLGTSPAPNLAYLPAPDPLNEPITPDHINLGPSTAPSSGSCNCAKLTISHHWPSVEGMAPGWVGTMMWPTGLSEGEFRKEECRRLVWSSVMLTASLNSYSSVLDDFDRTKLCINEPRNFALLFPGEALARAGTPVPPNNVWTLYLRSMLLMHACITSRADTRTSEAERAQFAMRAWLEIDALELALEQHSCGLERYFGFQAREMLFGSRMCVSHEFQRYIPQVTTNGSKLFYRDKAERWLLHRLEAAERVWCSLIEGHPTPAMDYRKPLLIYWFMSHIIKALILWRTDHTLIIALEASKSFARRTEYLMMFWPNPDQRREWQTLRYHLVRACLKSGVPPPEMSVPVPFPRQGFVNPPPATSRC